MRIQNTCYNNSFQANINSPRLRFKQADFFVKIRGYGTNTRWAKKTKETADTAVNMARKNTSAEFRLHSGCSFDSILFYSVFPNFWIKFFRLFFKPL